MRCTCTNVPTGQAVERPVFELQGAQPNRQEGWVGRYGPPPPIQDPRGYQYPPPEEDPGYAAEMAAYEQRQQQQGGHQHCGQQQTGYPVQGEAVLGIPVGQAPRQPGPFTQPPRPVIVEVRPGGPAVRNTALPCGCGLGWTMLAVGIGTSILTGVFGIICCGIGTFAERITKDPRERQGARASAIGLLIGIIAVMLFFTLRFAI
ncbi:unnamed protein product [Pedinophyceae sp. YPF-701]|nr:unnamed protein product [Pedinophyceae sp. YPF-701]